MPGVTTKIGTFIDDLFNEIFFQSDDALAAKACEGVAPDAMITVNGRTMSGSDWVGFVLHVFRKSNTAELDTNDDLAVAEEIGYVAQHSTFRTISKDDGTVTKQRATVICKVEEREGRKVVTKIDEVTESY